MVDRSTNGASMKLNRQRTQAAAPDPRGLRPPLVRRVDHIGIVVRDVEASGRQFVERFAMTVTRVVDLDDGSVRLLYLDAGSTTIQLVQPLAAGPVARHLSSQGEGLHHVCFVVDSLREAIASMSDEAETIGDIYRGGRGQDVVFLRSRCSEVLVELTEPPARAAASRHGPRRH
jgi:methylmalonyl-CoA/ethylmalonyl-CoA epimerase